MTNLWLLCRPRPGMEMTIESNPVSLSREWLEMAHRLGFNRLNIGVQSFEDRLLEVCGRPHDSRKAQEVIELAQGTGFDNVNVDLMFGLPSQTLEDWGRTLQTLIALQPASVTCYKLRGRNNPRTDFSRLPESAFPLPEDQLLMHIMAIEALCEAGYTPVHFENLFVRDPKYIHQQQEHKWQDGELLGLGPQAYSYVNGCVYHNIQSYEAIDEYAKIIKGERLPIDVGRVLNRIDLMHRWAVLGLMRLRLEREPFRARFGLDPVDAFHRQLQLRRMPELGLLEITDEVIRITKYPGLLFPMEILTSFYTEADKAKLAAKGLRYGSFAR